MDYSIVKERIKQCMEENEDTAANLSKKLGINRSTITRWFNGDTDSIKSELLMRISELYNVNIGWLLGEANAKKEVEPWSHASKRLKISEMLKDCSEEDLDKVEAMINLFIKKN